MSRIHNSQSDPITRFGIRTTLLGKIHPKERLVLGITGVSMALPMLLLSLVLSGPIVDGKVHLVSCFWKTHFAKECHSCGMTRSFASMWGGNLKLASAFNRGGPAAFVMIWIIFFLGAYFLGDCLLLRLQRRNL